VKRMDDFEPRLVGFLCRRCAYEAADAVGRAGKLYPSNLRIVRVPCSGRVDSELVMTAFRMGADGVVVLGCRPGECHHRQGNYLALRQHVLLKQVLPAFGVDPRRARIDWVSADEPERFVDIVTKMIDEVRSLGPAGLRRSRG
jgi:F420-non-reducing hydrogenase iron-sulfur subunit